MLFADNNALYNHIIKSHNDLENYECIFENCHCVYTLLNSFKKHVRAKHSIFPVESKCSSAVDYNFTNIQQSTNETEYEFDSDCDEYLYQEEANTVENMNININFDEALHSDWENYLKNASLKYTASLYNLKNIPRKFVNDIICETEKFLKITSNILKDSVINRLEHSNLQNLNEINKLFDTFSNCLIIVNSEPKCFTQFKKLKTFVYPESYDIGERREYRKVNNVQTLVHIKVNAQIIPLKLVFKLFFELPGIFSETMEYMYDLNSNDKIITNLIQGKYWKNRLKTFEK